MSVTKLTELIGQYGVQVSNTGVLAPSSDLINELANIDSELEAERMKVAGCSTAAFGYWKEGDSLNEEYNCAAIHDVASLYAKYEALMKEKALS